MCIFTCIRKVHIVFFIRVYYGGHMSNLRKYRESLNISQTTLAKAVGCTQELSDIGNLVVASQTLKHAVLLLRA